MTINLPPRVVSRRGMTLLELTITIFVIIALIAILFFGARAWKRGSDRGVCVLALRNVQVATRSYQNLYGYNYGGRPYADNGTQDIARHLFEKGYIEMNLYNLASGAEKCPAGGTYTRVAADVFPEAGELYMNCSLSASEAHEPSSHADW